MQKIHIGMRKVKSVCAVGLSFIVWQLIRIALPALEIHPVFAYIYAITDMKETVMETKDSAKLRIKATFIGLIMGLLFIGISSMVTQYIPEGVWFVLAELGVILLMVLCTLCIAELCNCKNFCGIAAIIAVICLVSHSGGDKYLYAITRVVQTLIGVCSAAVINTILKRKTTNSEDTQNEKTKP